MNILGLHDGHLATACLLVDGRIAAMVSEERLTRRKSQGGPPERAIGAVLEQAGLEGEDVDAVALASLSKPLTAWDDPSDRARRTIFQVASGLVPRSIVGNRALVAPYVWVYQRKRDWAALDRALERNGIPAGAYRSHRCEHHACHAATAYYLSWHREPSAPTLVVTIDGSGDGICATVGIGRDGRLERLHSIPSYHSIGELYTRVTQHLGMTPLEHEYKVMGLAPYAPPELAARAYRIFSTLYRATPDRLGFENLSGAWGPGLLTRLARDLRGLRFDAIAAGVQLLIEEIVVGFVKAWAARTGLRRVAVAGGVFMNVKVNMLLSEAEEIDELFLMPSCGDESVALGAALLTWAKACQAAGRPVDVPPLEELYLGHACSDEEVRAALCARRADVEWQELDDVEAELARRLAAGQIVGRMAGRMEWGARSLGNRAILADPRDPRAVRRLNLAIKMRDYWMPFAPSILEERADDYLVNPRRLRAPHMINAFRSTALAQRDLVCGLHPFDLSCRPQIVTERANPAYHRLLRAFERLTGVGGVLNTSFNLHGEPIVCRPADALHTLLGSGLDAVALGRFLVWRRAS